MKVICNLLIKFLFVKLKKKKTGAKKLSPKIAPALSVRELIKSNLKYEKLDKYRTVVLKKQNKLSVFKP